MQRIQVECYSGYKADERPLRFFLGETSYSVEEVLDQWYGPASSYFRVKASDGNLYVLRHAWGEIPTFGRWKPFAMFPEPIYDVTK